MLDRFLTFLAEHFTLAIAGLMGGVTFILVSDETTPRRAFSAMFIGLVFAIFLGPATARVMPFVTPDDGEVVAGLGLLWGVTGILFAEWIVRTATAVRDGEGYAEAARTAIISILSRKAPK